MSATEELCRLLRERGIPVVANDNDNAVYWFCGRAEYEQYYDGSTRLIVYDAIPEQAIAATVGCETCRNADARAEAGGVWHSPRFVCSKCGAAYVMSDYARFCPSCGRRVVE